MKYAITIETEMARKYGLVSAILYEEIRTGCKTSEAHQVFRQGGYFWHKMSVKDFSKHLSFASGRVVSNALARLEKDGLIVSCFSETNQFDRTKWYRIAKDADGNETKPS